MSPNQFVTQAENSVQGRTDSARLLLVLLLTTDALFIMFHIISWSIGARNRALNIELDGSYGEVFQYTKFVWAIILLGRLAARSRNLRFAAWDVVFFYFLIDDSLGIHENVGEFVASRWGFAPALGLRFNDFGELAVTALAATALGILVHVSQIGAESWIKRTFLEITGLVALLGFFGVFVDMLHMVSENGPLNFFIGTLEDGGEMVVASILVWYAFRIQEGYPVFHRPR